MSLSYDLRPNPYKSQKASFRWDLLLALLFINLIIAGYVSVFSVYIMFLDEKEIHFQKSIWIPTIYLTTWTISKVFWRRKCENWIENGSNNGRWWCTLVLFITFITILSASFTTYFWANIIINGVFTAAAFNLINIYSQFITSDQFPSRLNETLQISISLTQAVSHCVMSQLAFVLIKVFGLQQSQLMQAAIVLQMLPFILLLRMINIGLPKQNSRYSDFPRLSAERWDQEMVVYPSTSSLNVLSSNELYHYNWKNKSELPYYNIDSSTSFSNALKNEDTSQESVQSIVNVEIQKTYQEPPSYDVNSTKVQNSFGIEIMPEIPEEIEVESDDDEDKNSSKNNFSYDINRLSMISTQLENFIKQNDLETNNSSDASSQKTIKKWSIYCHFCFYNISKFCFNSILIAYHSLNVMFYDHFFHPLNISLRIFYFYPVLLSKLCSYFSYLIFVSTLPLITRKADRTVSRYQSTCVISIAAISWFLFALTTSWFLHLSKQQMKYVYIIGIVLKIVGFFVLSRTLSHEIILFGSIVCGFGFGVISFSENVIFREALGSIKWPKVQSTLDTLTGVFLILTVWHYFKIEAYLNNMYFFQMIYIFHIVIAIIWLISALVEKFKPQNNLTGSNWQSFIFDE